MITVKWITTTTCQTRPTWANVHQINYYLSRNFHAGYLPFPYCTFAFSVFTLEKSLLSYWTCLFVILPRMTVAKLHEMYEIYHRSDGWWWAFKYIWFIINIFFQKFTTKNDRSDDGGLYRCRADFKRQQTVIHWVKLSILGQLKCWMRMLS